MNRRQFLKTALALGLSSALPPGAFCFAAARPALPVPPRLEPDSGAKVRLNLQSGAMAWHPDHSTPTWGVNGPLLGPAVRLKRGQSVDMIVNNGLPEATTMHWHGLEVSGPADGGPQALINPGEQWGAHVLVDQPAATCWYHPHMHMVTGRHVAMGLGGLLLIEDERSAALPLPKTWGEDDIPVILQDKRLGGDGKIDYKLDVLSAAVGWFGDLMFANGAIYPELASARGMLRLRFLNACNARTLNLAASDRRPLYVIAGDNGFLPEPVQVKELTMYPAERFEVLVDASDGAPFDIITLPVRQMGMNVAPFDQPVPVLSIAPVRAAGVKSIPEKLVPPDALPNLQGLPGRLFNLGMDRMLDMRGMDELARRYGGKAVEGMDHGGAGGMDGMGRTGGMDHGSMGSMGGMGGMDAGSKNMDHEGSGGAHGMSGMGGTGMGGMGMDGRLYGGNFINGKAFDMTGPAFNVRKGQYEIWTISGENDKMLHPFHVHGTRFRILSENGGEPAKHRSGWKDVVHVENGRSRILVRFSHEAPPERMYMAHCHLLEHEDTGMMLGFTVSS